MRRGPWLAVIAAGSVLTGVSATGVIAPMSDVARTGMVEKESFATGTYATSIDLKLAPYDEVTHTCGAFTDDLDSPAFHVEDDAGFTYQVKGVCIRNDGVDETALRVRMADLIGTDVSCAPDEAPACDGNGELELIITLGASVYDDPACPIWTVASGLQGQYDPHDVYFDADGEVPSWESTALEPGIECHVPFSLMIHYSFIPGLSDPSLYGRQTDRLDWRFRFSSI